MAEVKQRNNLLDLLKMMSIACVVLIHVAAPYEGITEYLSPILSVFAVPIFIVISSYLRGKKIQKIGVKGAYGGKYMFISFMSLMLGYLIYVIVEILISLLLVHKGIPLNLHADFFDSVPKFLYWFFTGTLSFGSYYIPIMVELIVFLPLVYLLFKKNKYVGIIACFVINLAYDLLSHFLGMPSEAYRLLIFRYTLMIGFGIYLALTKEYNKREDIFAVVMLVLGAAYVIVNAYVYKFTIFDTWSTSSMFVAPFAYGFMFFMMKKFSGIKYRKIFVFGKASYHIYLVQMLFFFFYGNTILKKLFGGLPLAASYIIQAVVTLIITFGLGVLFYFLETKLRKVFKISH